MFESIFFNTGGWDPILQNKDDTLPAALQLFPYIIDKIRLRAFYHNCIQGFQNVIFPQLRFVLS